MNKEQVYEELKNIWKLTDETTDKEINEHIDYVCNCKEELSNIGRRLYCYEVALNSMVKDEDLEQELATEIYNEIEDKIYSKNERYVSSVMFYLVSAIIREDKYKNKIIEIDTLEDEIREIALDFIYYDNRNMSLLDSINEYIDENRTYIDKKIEKCFE